eukprot:6420002-Prymnesium_polylepis.1
MDDRKRKAIAVMLAMTTSSCSDETSGPRRKVARCMGKWRGSAVFGYLTGREFGRDDITYRENFRMSIGAFDKLADLLDRTAFGAKAPTDSTEALRAAARIRRGKGKKQTSVLALSFLDHPTTRFKLAAC